MHPAYEQLQGEIARSLEGLTAEQTQLRPANAQGKWTVQQIIQHLWLTYSSTEAVINERLAKGRATLAVPTLLQRCQQMFVIKAGLLPSGREAPSGVVPPPASSSLEDHFSGAVLTERTAQRLAHGDRVLQEAELRFGSGCLATHGVLGPLSAAQWRRFHLVHGRHHVKQIWAIRQDHQAWESSASKTSGISRAGSGSSVSSSATRR